MVSGVKPLVDVAVRPTAGDDAPRAAVVHARGVHGVLAVVVARLFGQDAFVVAEAAVVVVRVGEGAAGFDEVDGVPGFVGKRAARGQPRRRRSRRLRRGRRWRR